MKIKKIARAVLIAIAAVAMLFGLGIVGRQDYDYFVASHQPYAPKGGFIK